MSFAPLRFRYAALILCSSFAATKAYGQEHLPSIGFEYRFGLLTAATHAPNVVNTGPGDAVGTSQDHTFRIEYSREIASLFADNIALGASLGLSESIGSFSSSALALSYTGTFIHAAVSAGHTVGGLDLRIGGWLDVPLIQTLTRTPATNRSILYPQWPVGLRLGLSQGSWKIGGISIHPGLFGEFDFSAYRQPGSSGSLPLSGGVSFGIQLGKEEAAAATINSAIPAITLETPAPAQEPVPQAPVSPAPRVEAEIHFTALGHRLEPNESVPIEMRDTLIRQYTMLPTKLLLTSNRLAQNYPLLQPEEALAFTIDSLGRRNENGIANNILNIYGSRLRASPDFSVTIKYGKDNDEGAQEVLRYFRDVFDVPESRIELKKTIIPSGEIQIGTTGPVVTHWIERSYSIGDFGLEHTARSSRGIRSWSLDLSQGEELLSHLSSNGSPAEANLILTGLHAHAASALIATFTVEDSSGDRTASFDTLHLAVQPPAGHDVPARFRYVFLADSSRMPEINRLLAKLSESLPGNVTIDYYFGKAGFPTWLERKLSKLYGKKSSHLIDEEDIVGPRAVVTILKE